MYTMPTRELLLKKASIRIPKFEDIVNFSIPVFQVCGAHVQRNVDVLPKMLEVTADVFNRTHNLYEIHQLHALP